MKARLNITQQATIKQLRDTLGEEEETEQLIDWLLDAWETLELLRMRFGDATALKFFTAYAPLSQEKEQEAVMV